MDFICGSAWCHFALVHNRFFAAGAPHPTQAYAWPTFPLGEGFGRAYYFNKVLRLSPFFFQESLL